MTDFAYKVIVIGNKRVGKTAFIDRYVNGRFTGNYKSFFASKKTPGSNRNKLENQAVF